MLASLRQFDATVGLTQTDQNYLAIGTGNDRNVTVQTTYTADGQVATLTALNPATGDQVTQYVYGTSVGGIAPLVYRADLLRAEIYPDRERQNGQKGGKRAKGEGKRGHSTFSAILVFVCCLVFQVM